MPQHLPVRREDLAASAKEDLERLVEAYFSVTDAERILIDDTLGICQPSIHRANLDSAIPSLAFPEDVSRRRYADTLCDVLNRRARTQGIKISAEARVSKALNLILLTVLFSDERKAYREVGHPASLVHVSADPV